MIRSSMFRALTRALLVFALVAACHSDSDEPETVISTLTVSTSGNGLGKVTGFNPANDLDIDCPATTCINRIAVGRSITLAATPEPGSSFAGWTLGCSGIELTTTFEMGFLTKCNAEFHLLGPARTLTITENPAGTGVGKVTGPGIDCGNGGADCTEVYPDNEDVDLEVTAAAGSEFAGWSGDCLGFGAGLSVSLHMNLDKNCSVRYNTVAPGGLAGRGSFSFPYRVEAGALEGTAIFTAGYDNVGAGGEKIDFSDPDHPTSGAGGEFGSCAKARAASIFFSPDPLYNHNIVFATCLESREWSTTSTAGGLTQLNPSVHYEPGATALWSGTSRLAITDFEFGQLRLVDQASPAQLDVVIPLSTPLERSCPFSVASWGSHAYVVGREGVAGTSTENCNNWIGGWLVDLNTHDVDFLPFGTQPRDVEYGADTKVYVSDFAEDKVYVIDPVAWAVERVIPVGDGPVGLRINNDASRMYVTNWNSNALEVYDLSNDTRVDSVASGGVHPVDVYLTGMTVLVLNYGDAATNTGAVLKWFSRP